MSVDEGEPRIFISGAEAAEILGIHELSVSRLVGRGILRKATPHRKIGLDRADVEQLALERYAHKDHPYWTTTAGAAEILGGDGDERRDPIRCTLPSRRPRHPPQGDPAQEDRSLWAYRSRAILGIHELSV